MPFRKSFFKWAVARHDLRHAWPLWFGVTLPLALYQLMEVVDLRSLYLHDMTAYYDDPLAALGEAVRSQWADLAEAAVFITFVYACAVAMVVLHTLFQSRSALATHSLPVTRRQLFVGHLMSGLIIGMIPFAVMLAIGLLGLVGLPGITFGSIPLIFGYLRNALFSFLWYFGLAVLCGMLTGQLLAVPVLYLMLNFLPSLLVEIWDLLCGEFLLGYATPDGLHDVALHLSPTMWMMDTVDRRWENGIIRLEGGTAVWCSGLLGVGCLLLAAWLYHRRPLERAGETMVFAPLRVGLRWLIGLCGGLLGGIFCLILFNGGDFDSLWLYLYLAVFGCMGMLFTQMLLKKSFRVVTRQLALEFAGCAAVLAALVAVLQTGGFGYESRIPDPEKVESATLWESGYVYYGSAMVSSATIEVTDPEAIRQVLQWHEAYLQDPDGDEEEVNLEDIKQVEIADGEDYRQNYRYCYMTLDYRLKDGSTLRREYRFEISRHAVETPGTTDALYNDLWANYCDPTKDLAPGQNAMGELYISGQGVIYESDSPMVAAVAQALWEDMLARQDKVSLLEADDEEYAYNYDDYSISLYTSGFGRYKSIDVRLSPERYPKAWAAAYGE